MENNGTKLYAFDATEFEITFNARPVSATPAWVTHKLRKPTLEELIEWEKGQTYETVEVSKRENQIISDDDAATGKLWNKLILSVKGYNDTARTDGAEWHDLTDEEKQQMRSNHKAAAIRGLYRSSCSIEDNSDSQSVSLSGDTWSIKQEIGSQDDPYIVTHVLREPNEKEMRKFKQSAASTSFVRGAKKQHIKVATNLKAYIELYDALINTVAGATVTGQSGNTVPFVNAIDPIFKRQVISTLMEALDTQLQD